MRFFALGCSYRTAPVELRERLAFSAEELPRLLPLLCAPGTIEEAMLLSTCNRVEIYGVSGKPSHACQEAARFLAESRQLSPGELEPVLSSYQDAVALEHIFRVSASLEAMVVGEAQITGQVKEAYNLAARARTIGPLLSRCIHRAFAAAKRVRNETDIARHPVSVSSVAADLAGRVFGDLATSTVLVLGAGEMAELAVRHLLADGAKDIRVVNRTHERAVQLAFQLGAKPVPFEGLRGQLLLADVVIASTGSPQPILSRALLGEVMRGRKQRPLLLVDIAVPRDVEREAGQLANVFLYDVDDLEQVVAENLKQRQREARHAERILQVELEHFQDWLRAQDAVPVIKELRGHFTEVVRGEVEHAAQALNLKNGEQRQLLELLAGAIVNKLLHDPTVELKKRAARPDGSFLVQATRELFHLTGQAEEAGGSSDRAASRDEIGEAK